MLYITDGVEMGLGVVLLVVNGAGREEGRGREEGFMAEEPRAHRGTGLEKEGVLAAKWALSVLLKTLVVVGNAIR